ncbi:MAG TPA: hypothetical protein VNQ73_23700 [Ilumatobacter sp.]|nr:hypothetical protein [Ilumatobacter sp.]
MVLAADRLEFVERKPPLVFDEIDFTVVNPERLATRLADPLEYAQRVEHLVGVTQMETLMPRRSDEVERFLVQWTDDELGHARALGHLMELVGLQPVPLDGVVPPSQNAKIGALGRASKRLHEVIEVIWATSGAMNEHLAMTAYHRIDAILQADGEQALHETLFRRLRAHESAHKSFYATYAAARWATLRGWQRRLARATLRRTWAPVGATEAVDRPAFARTVVALSADDWRETLVDPLQSIAERIMGAAGEVGPIVERAVVLTLESDPAGEELLQRL